MKFKFNLENDPSTKKNIIDDPRTLLVINKFFTWAIGKKIDLNTLDTRESIEEALEKSHLPSTFKSSTKEVCDGLIKGGFVVVVPEKKEEKKVEHIGVEVKLKGVTIVEDEELKRHLEESHFHEELDKDVFKDKSIDEVYKKSLSVGDGGTNEDSGKIEHYLGFADEGLLEGGREEAIHDFKDEESKKVLMKEQNKTKGEQANINIEKNKKIATILERALSYCISFLNWYGENMKVVNTSEFDDIQRGVDEVLEILDKKGEGEFMGLGIDVTYRGLYSEKYKEKLFNLLKSIKKGYKTEIKYFKNSNGKRMKEFSVPKIILYFDVKDVKNMAHLIKNIDDEKVLEEFRNSPMKNVVMNQIITQCEVLARFSKECGNNISEEYNKFLNSIKELSEGNEDIKKIIESRHGDSVSIHMNTLINEFRDING